MQSAATILQQLRQGDRKALAQAITLLESTREDHRQTAEKLLASAMPFTGQSLRLGITGVPGVGKSTFIEAFGQLAIDQGRKLAVLTVDPSSSVTGGSILGDKTRMPNLSINPSAFIRPSPSGRSLGGVARRTHETMLICEAAGFDLILIETVGVGQSEIMVSQMTDLFLLMLLPSAGDDLQGIKRGIMELADIIVMNKADGDLVNRAQIAAADVKNALGLMHPRLVGWQVPVLSVSALHQQGLDTVWQSVLHYLTRLETAGGLERQRSTQAVQNMWREAGETILDTLRGAGDASGLSAKLEAAVAKGELPASVAARQMVRQFLDSDS